MVSKRFTANRQVISISYLFCKNSLDNNNFRPYSEESKNGEAEMGKIFGITILFFGLLAVITTYKDVSPFWFEQNQTEQIETLWRQDVELLVRSKSLPKEWTQVSEIKYFPLTDSVKELLSKIRPPLGTHPGGPYKMEVTIDDWKDGNDYGLMIQYQLFDIASQNLIWELGRTLIIADSKIVEKSGRKLKDKEDVVVEKSATIKPKAKQTPSHGKSK